jgi:hypothetical protein
MNKRQFLRLALHDLQATITREDDSVIQGTCLNLSGMGMLISVDTTLKEGEKLEVAINTNKTAFKVQANVIHQKDNDDIKGNSELHYGLKVNSIE